MKMCDRNKTLCYFALPVLLLAACVLQPTLTQAQMTSVGIDCSQINALQLMKQDNMRAGQALIECGLVQRGQPARADGDALPVAPPNIRASNRKCTSASSCTKSESMVWANPTNDQNIVVNYNDHNAGQYSGTSYSVDGGATFKEISPPPFGTGHSTNFGDPIIVFNAKLNKWFGGDLVSGCGGQGVGLWTSNDGKTWAVGACAHNSGGDDRESMWVDNEPTSGTYGRMYISFNNFVIGGSLSITHSDNGTSWSSPAILNSNFIRDVQVTGSPVGATRFEGNNSTVFVASMDEGSNGGLGTRQNVMYKSLDGGVTWTSSTMGPRFNAVGDRTCTEYNSYFAVVNPIWRHMGWGEPAVGPNGVVHYVYAGAGTNGDHGDIFYARSTNNGKTWSKPKKLNTDTDNSFREQWMPSLSAELNGKVTASWYDRRKSTSACNNVTDPGCKYERVARQSNSNGATFLPEISVSGVLIPEPAQPDPGIVPCYAGDYDYNTALNGNAFVTWTDGRRAVGGTHVQDVDFAKVPLP
jgi:hypothetical protein